MGLRPRFRLRELWFFFFLTYFLRRSYCSPRWTGPEGSPHASAPQVLETWVYTAMPGSFSDLSNVKMNHRAETQDLTKAHVYTVCHTLMPWGGMTAGRKSKCVLILSPQLFSPQGASWLASFTDTFDILRATFTDAWHVTSHDVNLTELRYWQILAEIYIFPDSIWP